MHRAIRTLTLAIICILSSHTVHASIVGSKHDFSMSGTSPFARNFNLVGSSGQSLGRVDEVCVFCHTPHGASSDNLYKDTAGGFNSTILWNRVVPVSAGSTNDVNNYTLYSSSTITLINLTAPTGISLMCLSCHDGVTAIAVQDPANPSMSQNLLERGAGNPTIRLVNTNNTNKIGDIYFGDPLVGGWGANIGELVPSTFAQGVSKVNLSNDHPVSFSWVQGIPGIKTNAPTDARLRLFGSQQRMECATCHNVHDDTTYPPFLVMSNSGSAMCFACHDK